MLFRSLFLKPWVRQTFRFSSSVTVNLDKNRSLVLETGKLARMADGAVVARFGDTSVLVTAVSRSRASSANFLPLTVDYRQKAAAAGRIPTNFLRRELGPSDVEILTSRMIDRTLRPLFSQGYYYDTQVICNLLAVDGVCDPDVLSINAASAALAVSDIPWNGPVAAVKLGYVDGEVIINPNRKQIQKSQLNMMLTGAPGRRIMMVDMNASELPLNEVQAAVDVGLNTTESIINAILQLQSDVGKTKREVEYITPKQKVIDSIFTLAQTKIRDVFGNSDHDKFSRDNSLSAIKTEVVEKITENYPDDVKDFDAAFADVVRQVYKDFVFETNKRCDGRDLTQLRPINCQVQVYKPLHGSAIFQRGQTQVLGTVTFDSKEAAFRSDAMSVLSGASKEKSFLLHYDFPPYATNEVSTGRFSGRRELGHGALAEKALKSVVPSEFPFTIRLTSEVLESNGSSSMASVCVGSMALMDAGVPLKSAASGVAIGLLTRPDINVQTRIADYRLLTDILGFEDYFGDMDFKVAGTRTGLTAAQLDLKISGLSQSIFNEALEQAQKANEQLLDIMAEEISEPRPSLKENGPVSEKLTLTATKRARLVGIGGYNLKRLQSEVGIQLTSLDENTFEIFAPNKDAMTEAKEQIDQLLADDKRSALEFGAVYSAKIVEMRENGLMVILYPEMKPTFIHISQLDQRRVRNPSALGFSVGQTFKVKYFGLDPASGTMRLSRKILQTAEPAGRRMVKKDETPPPEETLPTEQSPWVSKNIEPIDNDKFCDDIFQPTHDLQKTKAEEVTKSEIIFQPLNESISQDSPTKTPAANSGWSSKISPKTKPRRVAETVQTGGVDIVFEAPIENGDSTDVISENELKKSVSE